jgi:DNA-binding CsgD family transcriptional regulator
VWKVVLPYALALAAAAFALEQLEYRYFMRMVAPEAYVLLLAAGFTALGGYVGNRLTPGPARRQFVRNDAAITTLGITGREYEALERLAAGAANKEIARAMGVSPNTVKSHLASLYGKLEAARRTDAVARARALGLIP